MRTVTKIQFPLSVVVSFEFIFFVHVGNIYNQYVCYIILKFLQGQLLHSILCLLSNSFYCKYEYLNNFLDFNKTRYNYSLWG